MDNENPQDLSFDDLTVHFVAVKQKLEELDAYRKEVGDILLQRLKDEKVDRKKTKNGYFVKRISRTDYSGVSMSVARELDAIKIEEKVDSKKLSDLTYAGVQVPGVKTIVYVKVDEAE